MNCHIAKVALVLLFAALGQAGDAEHGGSLSAKSDPVIRKHARSIEFEQERHCKELSRHESQLRAILDSVVKNCKSLQAEYVRDGATEAALRIKEKIAAAQANPRGVCLDVQSVGEDERTTIYTRSVLDKIRKLEGGEEKESSKHKTRMSELRQKMLEDYERLHETATKAGKLDTVVEIERRVALLEKAEDAASKQSEDLDVVRDAFGDVRLAAIQIGKANCPVRDLEKGSHRLRDADFAKLDFVDIPNAKFCVVGWKTKPSYRVRVVRSGQLYAMPRDFEFRAADMPIENWIKAGPVVKGPWISSVHRKLVYRGQTFEISGYELSLIAAEIAKP